MMIPELPGYLTSLGGANYKGLIIALFTLMAAISRPFSGKLTDTVGRVPVMIFGSLVCVVCSLLYPLLATVSGFLLLRFFHGFSTGFKPTATSAYGADVVHPSRRGEALGALSIGYTVGMSLGPLVGSFMVNHFSYNAMFYTSAAFAMGSVAILYNVRETLPDPQRFQFRILNIQRDEIIEMSSLRPAMIMLLLSFSSGCAITLAPDQSVWLGISNKGLFFACYTVTSLLIRLVAGKSSDHRGRVPILIVSAAVLCLSMLMLCIAHTPLMFMLAAAVFGMSWGMNGPTIAAWTVDLCRPDNRGRAVATMYIALEVGIGLGAILSAMIYGNQSSHFAYAYILPAVLAMLATALLFAWRKFDVHRTAALVPVEMVNE